MIVESMPAISYAEGAPGGTGSSLWRGDHVAPPRLANVPFQFHAQRAVVPEAVQAAVDIARRENEPPPLAESHKIVHFNVGVRLRFHTGSAKIKGYRPKRFSVSQHPAIGQGGRPWKKTALPFTLPSPRRGEGAADSYSFRGPYLPGQY